jgi:hypothetical protein
VGPLEQALRTMDEFSQGGKVWSADGLVSAKGKTKVLS